MVKSILFFRFIDQYFSGTYESGVGSLTSHPYQYQTNNNGQNHKDHHQSSYPTEQSQHIAKNNKQQLNSNASKINEKPQTMNINNHNAISYGTTKMIQLPPKKNLDNQYGESKNHQQVNTYCKNVNDFQMLPVHAIFIIRVANLNVLITLLYLIMNVRVQIFF